MSFSEALNDSKYSIRAEQARINGKSKASIEAARKLGKKYGKLNMEKYMFSMQVKF